ncbi:hypothetical protein DTL21_14180 [Bremerella cremea]|uniref:DUF5673 domain-containing protein n=1 Tax=Blastopirellula marina TaxID=124 RepID=A0A2S8FRG5_9BACT|nr:MULTISPECIES: hypothetical protein [Pirellulaceae]PQO34650.1 hypothetical protein C5Y83_14175 [Blastopirellula marina]RCS47147.1 hypothetical protein DTL21_14180 [Bremerella cremea]
MTLESPASDQREVATHESGQFGLRELLLGMVVVSIAIAVTAPQVRELPIEGRRYVLIAIVIQLAMFPVGIGSVIFGRNRMRSRMGQLLGYANDRLSNSPKVANRGFIFVIVIAYQTFIAQMAIMLSGSEMSWLFYQQAALFGYLGGSLLMYYLWSEPKGPIEFYEKGILTSPIQFVRWEHLKVWPSPKYLKAVRLAEYRYLDREPIAISDVQVSDELKSTLLDRFGEPGWSLPN